MFFVSFFVGNVKRRAPSGRCGRCRGRRRRRTRRLSLVADLRRRRQRRRQRRRPKCHQFLVEEAEGEISFRLSFILRKECNFILVMCDRTKASVDLPTGFLCENFTQILTASLLDPTRRKSFVTSQPTKNHKF